MTSILSALEDALGGSGCEMVVEAGRIRILRRAEALELWKRWAEE